MADELAPLSDLSEQSSDENSAELPSKSPGDKSLDQGARSLLNIRGYRDGSQSGDKDSKDNKNDDGPRRATRSSARLQASQTQKGDVVKSVAPYAAKSSTDRTNVLQESGTAADALKEIPQPQERLAQLLNAASRQGSTDILALDPSDRLNGYNELEDWVDGSLDMYKPEFRPVLFPVFCHFYLDLVRLGLKEMAQHFYKTFCPPLTIAHSASLHHLSTILLPLHAETDHLVQRFRGEKYILKMTKAGFSLLIGWLTEGSGGEIPGAGQGFEGEAAKRGRMAVMQVVNNHLQFDICASNTTVIKPQYWEESAVMTNASLIPQGINASYTDARAFNGAQGPLKLGAAPLDDTLKQEAERVLREEANSDPHAFASLTTDILLLRPTLAPGLVEPTASDLLPQPPSFRTLDVKREVERVKDARKRIRLDPSHLTPQARNMNSSGPQVAMARARSLPSVCAYTLHDTSDSLSCSSFSADSSLLACGFSESYIRMWSLKGEKLKGMRSDFQESTIKDAAGLKKLKEKGGSSTRKLIGHSGPVYSAVFDPVAGTSVPPRHLLSSSADGTARLWSLDTMSNIVVYRSHENPIWDVQWSPMGIYFATASRDRTARLWTTDRMSPLRIFAGHLSDVDCIRFHPNSLYLATGSSDWTCRLWDVHRGNTVRVFLGHQGAITAMAMSMDGKYLASASEDLTVKLWDLGSGNCVKTMTGHTGLIHSLAFSAESSVLVTGGADWTVRCWDVKASGGRSLSSAVSNNKTGVIETSDLLATFPTKRTPIVNVHFTPRNLCLVAGPSLAYEYR